MYDLIIFDCDGTLVDSETLNNRAMLDVLHEDGFTQYDMAYAHRHWLGTTVSDSIAAIARETGRAVATDMVERYIQRVHSLHETELLPVAGAPLLAGACAAKYDVCVASNGERNNVLQSLALTGLLPFFTEARVFTKIQVARPKPWPDLFLFAAAQRGAAPARCLVIEDSAAGVRAAVAAGMTAWGFTGTAPDPQAQAETLLQAGAHSIFARLEQIADIL